MNDLLNNDLAKPSMIFVVGNSRSGTTMMARILGKNPSVFMFEELHFFEQLWQPTIEQQILPSPEAVFIFAKLLNTQKHGYYNQQDLKPFLGHSEEILANKRFTGPQLYSLFIQHTLQEKQKQISCDHTPRNVYYLNALQRLYPEAKFINMVRDPRDVLLSQKNRWQRRRLDKGKTPLFHTLRTWAGYHPVTISLMWRSGIMAVLSLEKDDNLRVIKFENLVNLPNEAVKDICNFLKIPFQEQMLQVPQIGSSNRADSSQAKGIDSAVVGKWKLPKSGLRKEEVYLCQLINGNQMKQLGYKYAEVKPNWLLVFYFFVTWIFKSTIAVMLNFHRTKNIWQSIKVRLFSS